MEYNFNVTLHPYDYDGGVVGIDTTARYGYWEHHDGCEGGGLWFDADGAGLVLTDYDGAYALPLRVLAALRDAGVIVGSEFG